MTLSGQYEHDLAVLLEDQAKLGGVEPGATADQSNAEIEAGYNAQVAVVSQATAEAGTDTTVRRWTAERVAQAIAALASGGGIGWRSGGTYYSGVFLIPTTTTATAGSGTISYTPFFVPEATTLTVLYAEVTTAVGGSTCRMAIFQDAGAGQPGDLIEESSAVATTSTGVVSHTLSGGGLDIGPGTYWFAFRASASGLRFRAAPSTSCTFALGSGSAPSSLGNVVTQVVETGSYGAFPATASPTGVSGASVPLVAAET